MTAIEIAKQYCKENRMGYYIQAGRNKGKADELVSEHGAIKLNGIPAWCNVGEDVAVICVVDNGPFEAAAFCYSENELREFSNYRDTRPKTWLVMDRNKAETLSGYKR